MLGRERFVAVDPLGLIWALSVTTADVQDRDGGCWLLQPARGKLPRTRDVVADAVLTRRFAEWVRRHCGWRAVTTHNAPMGFTVHARRCVVERTFAWLVRYRRLGKDRNFMTESSKAMIYAAITHRMLRWLHPADKF